MTVTERPRLILPGLVPADPRLERYRVRPGAVTAVELGPGDEITVIDPDGRQRGELTVLRPGGGGFAALGVTADGPATVLRALDLLDAAAAMQHQAWHETGTGRKNHGHAH